jgi:hypothetical protein
LSLARFPSRRSWRRHDWCRRRYVSCWHFSTGRRAAQVRQLWRADDASTNAFGRGFLNQCSPGDALPNPPLDCDRRSALPWRTVMMCVGVQLLRGSILGLMLVLLPNLSAAQDTTKHPRVGIIFNDGPGPVFDALRQGFAQLGYVEGRNIVIEGRFAYGNLDRVPELAANW